MLTHVHVQMRPYVFGYRKLRRKLYLTVSGTLSRNLYNVTYIYIYVYQGVEIARAGAISTGCSDNGYRARSIVQLETFFRSRSCHFHLCDFNVLFFFSRKKNMRNVLTLQTLTKNTFSKAERKLKPRYLCKIHAAK